MEKMLLKKINDKKVPKINYKYENKKVALLFWGLSRSSKWTYSSLKMNILNVLEKNKIEYKIFFHTYFLKDIYNNKRANEINIKIDNEDYKILKPDNFSYDWQEDVIKKIDFKKYYPEQDPWSNNFETFKNYILAMKSQKKVTEMFLEKKEDFDYVIYLRPDVNFLDKFNVNWFDLCKDNCIITPKFDKYGGINDRFAIMKKDLVKIYGCRIDILIDKLSLSSERRLLWIFEKYKIKNIDINFIFQRIRITGKIDVRDLNIYHKN